MGSPIPGMGGGGGGGGCFVAGTKILVPNPNKDTDDKYCSRNIEELVVGDEIISFNDKLELVNAKVTCTFRHEPRAVMTVKAWGGTYELTGTPEHFVYAYNIGAFARLDSVDVLTSRFKGILPVVERIVHDEPAVVYNLTVEPNHTYVANQILVHNMGGGGGGDEKEQTSSQSNPMFDVMAPLMKDAVAKYQQLYGDYYWPMEETLAGNALRWTQGARPYDERVQDYLMKRSDQVLGVAEETNPLLDESRKDLIRRLVEGEDVLADRYRSSAAADTSASFAQQRSQMQDKMSQLGINPNSGAWASSLGNLGSQEALGSASAMTQATRSAEDESLKRQITAQDMYTNPNRLLGEAQPGLNMNTLFSATAGSAPTTTTTKVSGGSGGSGGLGSILGAGMGLAGKFMGK